MTILMTNELRPKNDRDRRVQPISSYGSDASIYDNLEQQLFGVGISFQTWFFTWNPFRTEASNHTYSNERNEQADFINIKPDKSH